MNEPDRPSTPGTDTLPGAGNVSPRVPARVYLQGSESHLMTVVRGGYPPVQRHDALIVLARGKSKFTLRSGSEESLHDAVVIRPSARHGIMSNEGFALIAVHLWHPLFKGLSAMARQPVVRLARADFAPFDERLEEAIDCGFDADGAANLVEEISATVLVGAPPVPPMDPRVFSVMRILDANISAPFEEIALQVGVSRSRLSHLFASDLGLSFRAFLAWLRLRGAWEMIVLQPGMSLGEIAEEMGYADAGHMSRSFRESFGITPTTMRDKRREIIGYPLPRGRRAGAGQSGER